MYKRVLVPLDGSLVAEGILPFILEIAGPLDLVAVLPRIVPWGPPPASERGSYSAVDDVQTSMDKACAYLAGIARGLRVRAVRVETRVRYGDPAREILAGAAETGADLIAMTTHGRSGLGRLLFGSVAEAMLRRADIPVFLMRLTDSTINTEGTPWRRTA
jgi:nucleotide-binding universal stress UspA family protein